MSFAIDANVLVFGSHLGPKNRRAVQFLERAASGTEIVCIAWTTVMAYLRITTHPSIFPRPFTPDEAAHNIETFLAMPHVRVLSEQEGFWQVYRDVTRDVPARGNVVPDAHLAALLHQHGIRKLYTNDTDFRKFRFLDVEDPFL